MTDQSIHIGIFEVANEIGVGDNILLVGRASAVNVLTFARRVALVTNTVEVVEKLALEVCLNYVRATKNAKDIEARDTVTLNLVLILIAKFNFLERA